MSSSKVSESNSFYESMFNFRRIILAPLVIIFAYLVIIIIIFRNKWNSEKNLK